MQSHLTFQESSRFRVLPLITLFAIGLATTSAYANDYAHIVVFGDSLSDTGNVAHLTQAKYGVRVPGPSFDYTDGRFTDGRDTLPPAQKYFGVWIEQLAASMPLHPQVKNSLDGGTNYAYGFAFTGNGTTTLALNTTVNSPFVIVENMGQQITDYLATKPKIDSSTLFIVWGGANDLLNATSANDVANAAIQETLDIQRLINAGATQFLVLNSPPLGLTPRLNGSLETSVAGNTAAALFNAWLATGLSVLRDFYPFRHIAFYRVDVFAIFNQIVANPGEFALTNTTVPSQANPSVLDPDTYLFWDALHPTTRGHNLVADAAIKAMSPAECELLPDCAVLK